MSDKKKPIIGKGVFFVPKIANDKSKRERIRNIRQNRRSSLKSAETREQRKSIREKARNDIRTERGGISQVREVFQDVKDFGDQLNRLKSNVENTTVGRVANLAKNLIGHISSGNIQGIAGDVERGVSIAKGNKKQTKKNNCN